MRKLHEITRTYVRTTYVSYIKLRCIRVSCHYIHKVTVHCVAIGFKAEVQFRSPERFQVTKEFRSELKRIVDSYFSDSLQSRASLSL